MMANYDYAHGDEPLPGHRPIDARAHAVLDYATAGLCFAMAFALRHRNRTAARFAGANGAAVMLLSLLTDYPGGAVRRIGFRTHGLMDAVQAAVTAAGPAILGFAGRAESAVFYAQAAAEAAVIAATDWGRSPSSTPRLDESREGSMIDVLIVP